MAIPSSAEGGREAIHAAGLAVNHLDLSSPEKIRRAVPIARAAALRVKSWLESQDWKTGDFTGLPIAIYQNWLYEQNREWYFTDGTLCVLWCVEIPHSRCDYPKHHDYIASTRREYNAGRHQAPAPEVPSVSYGMTAQAPDLVGGRSVETTARPTKAPAPPREAAAAAVDARPTQVTGQADGSQPSPESRLRVFALSSNPAATRRRLDVLDRYMSDAVMTTAGIRCSAYAACRASHPGKFFEGQLHHVGEHYDMSLNGRPFRIAVVGQEYGNGPALVPRATRSHDVVVLTGRQRRFTGDGQHPPRNPHMRGTTSVLRLLLGHSLGRDYEGEYLSLGGQSVHIFEAFALTNFLLCSAIDADESEKGSKRGISTTTMQRNCARHFAGVVRILEPNLVVVQGKGVRRWLEPIVHNVVSISENLERVAISGNSCLLATFTHPSVPSRLNWGTDERRPYLLEVVAPTVEAIHREVARTATS